MALKYPAYLDHTFTTGKWFSSLMKAHHAWSQYTLYYQPDIWSWVNIVNHNNVLIKLWGKIKDFCQYYITKAPYLFCSKLLQTTAYWIYFTLTILIPASVTTVKVKLLYQKGKFIFVGIFLTISSIQHIKWDKYASDLYHTLSNISIRFEIVAELGSTSWSN